MGSCRSNRQVNCEENEFNDNNRTGGILGRDRKGSPFMVRHYDFIYEIETQLPDGKTKKDRPYFLPGNIKRNKLLMNSLPPSYCTK